MPASSPGKPPNRLNSKLEGRVVWAFRMGRIRAQARSAPCARLIKGFAIAIVQRMTRTQVRGNVILRTGVGVRPRLTRVATCAGDASCRQDQSANKHSALRRERHSKLTRTKEFELRQEPPDHGVAPAAGFLPRSIAPRQPLAAAGFAAYPYKTVEPGTIGARPRVSLL